MWWYSGEPQSWFYLINMKGCWMNNSQTCDGDVGSDVTCYVEMIINPQTPFWCRLHLSLSLNFSTFDCSYVHRISVQETVTPLYVDYLPIHKIRDFVFSYSCYASQCGLLKIWRPSQFWLVAMFQMVNIDIWIQTLSKKLATRSQS
jgi:hypothetical protein